MVTEVFLLDPSSRFVIVSFPGPLPQHLKDGTVYILKDFFAHHMLMIPCPSSNERVEQQDQVTSSGSLMVLDHFSGFFQKRFHVLFRRLDDELTVVLAYRLSFALWHWRYPGKSDRTSCSNPSRVRFASTGEIGPPCGVPSSVR